ncbi:MAG: endo-1,4-beta-xylanase [Muribaculaceae bacterium]|nr:endo-1,4-beta-xylanase [Muribaculaceae bacterium]
MKYTRLVLGLLGVSMAFASCNDDLMEWRDPDGTVRPEELPLELREKIARYDYVKNYMEEYRPGVDITVGMGLDNFLDIPIYEQTVLDNFQGCTFGNALKHQSVVQNNGSYNWGTVDRFLAKETGLKVHGHNMLWHTQQNQSYLRSLIAPELQMGSTDSDIFNMLVGDDSNFDGGTKGSWNSWGNDSETEVVAPGRGDSGYCLKLMNPAEADFYQAQAAYSFSSFLEPGNYKMRFYAKADAPGQLQFRYQNSEYGHQPNFAAFNVGTDWTLCEQAFELTHEDIEQILINFGQDATTFYVDDIEFGLVNEEAGEPSDPMINVLPANASTFDGLTDGSTGGWGSWGGNKDEVKSVAGEGPDGSVCVMLKNNGDGDAWEAQFAYTFDQPLEQGVTYIISFDAKSESGAGQLQFQYQNGTSYGSQGGYHTFEIGKSWTPCEYEFVISDYDDVDRIILNFGAVGDTYYIDNIKFGASLSSLKAPKRFTTRASSVYYVLKSADEKKALLLGAMEEWIKEAMLHVGKYCTSYDVINEPIGDDATFRGINARGWSGNDKEPVEDTVTGLNLNWENGAGNGHFYWGYYIGMDYAVKAFQFARKYADQVNPEVKLFVNDYNLETNPAKLAKLIEFAEYIDNNGAHVDGLGTQMHVTASSITKEQVDAMFQTMAKTGKLIRITELDVALGTAAPSVEEQQLQSDVYQMILTSYFENIPKEQQHGVTIWSLTDNAKEHEYWLNGDTPNIFDADYQRKLAYKGVCDAIIGFDPSGDWESPDFSKKPSAVPSEDTETEE